MRDLELQPPAARLSEDGTRNLERMVKRRRGETEWELIDHVTRKVRKVVEDSDDESD